MKIGILTFHRAYNYGAVLQCFALQEYLKSCGHEVYVVDYRNEYLLRCYRIFDRKRYLCKNPITMVKKTLKELTLLPRRIQAKKTYEKFVLKHLSVVRCNQKELDGFDYFVVGSDQVWNVHLTGGFDHFYWGEFKRKDSSKIISYAASVEELWNDEHNREAMKKLHKFNAVSVREPSLKKFLFEKDAELRVNVSVDPTLLMARRIWDAIAIAPQKAKRYVFLYQVRCSDFGFNLAQKIADELGVELICMSANMHGLNSKECIGASPEQFLGYIKNAEYVVCSSFHGTVFSLLFQKRFYSLKLNDGRDDRVENLLESLNLLNRFVDSIPKKISLDVLDCVDSIEKISAESKRYLREFI